MKKSVIILIIVCIIVFITSTTAAVALTIRHGALLDDISWDSRLAQRLDSVIDRIDDSRFSFSFGFGPTQSYTIDSEHVFELDASIRRIEISGLAEDVTIDTDGDQILARMHGNYRARSTPIDWQASRQGNTLKIGAKYPRHGMTQSDLQIDLVIPADYNGEVYISTLSGDCLLAGLAPVAWSRFDFDALSGDLDIPEAVMPRVEFSTLSGDVRLENVAGTVAGDTMSGNVHLTLSELHTIDVETLSGDVDLYLPPQSDADIEFSTLSGSFVSRDLSLQFSKQENRHVVTKLNAGGSSIQVETMSGDFLIAGR